MTYFEFFSKYSDMFYYLTFLLGITNISYNFFEYLSFSHKYDSSQLSKMEGRIHMRLNDIDNKINMLYKLNIEQHIESESESESNNNESVMEDEDNNSDEQSDYEIEEDADNNENEDNGSESESESESDSHNKETLETLETIEELEEPDENVCVDQNDINDYYKDKFIKDKQSNSLSLSGVFRGWY